MTIKEVKPQTTAEQKNDSPPPSSSKEQNPLTDEEIHIKDVEERFHREMDEIPDEEFDIEW